MSSYTSILWKYRLVVVMRESVHRGNVRWYSSKVVEQQSCQSPEQVGKSALALGGGRKRATTASAASLRAWCWLCFADCCFCEVNTTNTSALSQIPSRHAYTFLKMLAGRSFAAPARQCMRTARFQQISRPAFVSCTNVGEL
jgi:hypothetical protein